MPSAAAEASILGWVGDKQVPVGSTKEGPSAVVFKDKLYLFYQGTKHGRIWWNSFQNNEWKSNDVELTDCRCSSCPSAVVWNDRLYVFYQGAGDNGNMYYNTLDDNQGWLGEHEIDGCRLSSSPSAVVFGGQIYLFHQGSGDSPKLYYNVTHQLSKSH